MTTCLIALGGNQAISPDVLEAAFQSLRCPGFEPVRMSSVFRTTPVGVNAGDEFLNAAGTAETDLQPLEVLSRLHLVEQEFGRQRIIHWGPRTLDLDLIFYGDSVVQTSQLCVPHRAMWYRRFVLDPAAEVAADWIHPVLQESVGMLHERLLSRPLTIGVELLSPTVLPESVGNLLAERQALRPEIQWQLRKSSADRSRGANEFAVVALSDWAPDAGPETPDPCAERRIPLVGVDVSEIRTRIIELESAILG